MQERILSGNPVEWDVIVPSMIDNEGYGGSRYRADGG